MKILEVEWVDSSQHSGQQWYTRSDVLEDSERGPARCYSVGYLLHEDKEHVTLIQGHSGDQDEVQSPLSIPRGCIVRIHHLTRTPYKPVLAKLAAYSQDTGTSPLP